MKTFVVNTKEMLAEHKRIIPELRRVGLVKEANDQTKELKEIKKKAILKKYTGRGGIGISPYKQVANPINLLKYKGEPPTASGVPKTKDNFLGNKLTK